MSRVIAQCIQLDFKWTTCAGMCTGYSTALHLRSLSTFRAAPVGSRVPFHCLLYLMKIDLTKTWFDKCRVRTSSWFPSWGNRRKEQFQTCAVRAEMRLSFLLLSLVVLIGLSLARRDFDGAPPGLGGGFIPPGQAKKMAKFGGMGDGGFGGRGAGPPGECKLHRVSITSLFPYTYWQ